MASHPSEAMLDDKPLPTNTYDLEKQNSRLAAREDAESALGTTEDESDSEAKAVGGKGDGIEDADLEKAQTQPSHHADGPPATRTVTAQDWSGPDDPENPQNWSVAKRVYITTAIASMAFALTAGTSLVSPAVFEIDTHFHVSRTAAILTLTLFVLGLAAGPVIAAPLSETLGRAVVYKISGFFYIIFLIGSGFTKSFGGFLALRLLAGIAGSPVLAVGGGTIADMYTQANRALASAFFIMSPFLGPALGPVIGGFAAQFKGWRWTVWSTVFIAAVAYCLVLPIPETYKKVILQKRAKRLGIPPPPAPAMTKLQMVKLLLTITLARPLIMLVTEPIVLLISLYNAFTFSVLFAFFAAYPYVFERVYHFNTWQYGLTFLGIGLGVLLAIVLVASIDRLVYTPMHRRAVEKGLPNIQPEHRLYAGMVGAFLIPIGLFWWAWTARRSVHWISPVLAGVPFAAGNAAVFISAATYLMDVYGPMNGASSLAANGLARYTMGAVFPLFTVQMYSKLGIGWATSLLGFIALAMIPIPWVFYQYGPAIRMRSRYSLVAQQKKAAH